jgi:RNA polymerase sigma-70 factor (ECF subfamily)
LGDQAASTATDEAFELLYEEYRLQVYRTIRGVVLDAAAAEDLTQETFERAYKARGSLAQVTSVGAWLHRIAINTAISYVRRQKLARLLPMRLFGGAESGDFDQAEDRSLVGQALSALSPKLRAVVVLRFYAGMTRDEIASVLRIPPGTVASRLGAALETMRGAISATDQDRLHARLRGERGGERETNAAG